MADNVQQRVPFVEHLVRLKARDDRAALAKLRRGVGKDPGAAPEMFPHIAPWLGKNDTGPREARFYLTASLFAVHLLHSDDIGSMGETFHRIAQAHGGDGPERRFVALLNAHPEDLAKHLRHAVSLAAAKNIPVNYHRLFRDLGAWASESRHVQRSWARDFWGASRPSESENEKTNEE